MKKTSTAVVTAVGLAIFTSGYLPTAQASDINALKSTILEYLYSISSSIKEPQAQNAKYENAKAISVASVKPAPNETDLCEVDDNSIGCYKQK